MVHREMLHPMDDIVRQARQGSVAAIIQMLNEQLADTGVRTRAVFDDGVLQLLCEAATPEQLEQSVLVQQIRRILEDIAPRNIRRVQINSRIVREQQLLWLEEITRDPEQQLLWSEEITLKRPNLIKQLTAKRPRHYNSAAKKPVLPRVTPRNRNNNRFWRGIISGVSLSVLLIILGGLLSDWLRPKLNAFMLTQATNSPESSPTSTPSPTPKAASASDSFIEAVRLAEQAAAAGRTAQTSAQWLGLAAKWERAADLMGAVKQNDPRYKTAQDRMRVYRKNSETAQVQARQRRS